MFGTASDGGGIHSGGTDDWRNFESLTILGTGADDLLIVANGAAVDTIDARSGNDTIYNSGFVNSLSGSDGSDTIWMMDGSSGTWIFGGAGDDYVVISNYANLAGIAYGGSGNDELDVPEESEFISDDPRWPEWGTAIMPSGLVIDWGEFESFWGTEKPVEGTRLAFEQFEQQGLDQSGYGVFFWTVGSEVKLSALPGGPHLGSFFGVPGLDVPADRPYDFAKKLAEGETMVFDLEALALTDLLTLPTHENQRPGTAGLTGLRGFQEALEEGKALVFNIDMMEALDCCR